MRSIHISFVGAQAKSGGDPFDRGDEYRAETNEARCDRLGGVVEPWKFALLGVNDGLNAVDLWHMPTCGRREAIRRHPPFTKAFL